MRRSFRFKSRLSPSAARRARGQLALAASAGSLASWWAPRSFCADLYNAARQERRDAFERAGVFISGMGSVNPCGPRK